MLLIDLTQTYQFHTIWKLVLLSITKYQNQIHNIAQHTPSENLQLYTVLSGIGFSVIIFCEFYSFKKFVKLNTCTGKIYV